VAAPNVLRIDHVQDLAEIPAAQVLEASTDLHAWAIADAVRGNTHEVRSVSISCVRSARTREIPGSLPEGDRQGLVALLDHGVPVRVGERVQVAALDGADRRPARFLRADPPVERVVLPRDVDIFEPAAGQVGRPVA